MINIKNFLNNFHKIPFLTESLKKSDLSDQISEINERTEEKNISPDRTSERQEHIEAVRPDWLKLLRDWDSLTWYKITTAGAQPDNPLLSISQETIPIKEKIYRGCRCYRQEDALLQLDEPRFWSKDRNKALSYANWIMPDEKYSGKRMAFIIEAEIIKESLFAKYNMNPVVGKVYYNMEEFNISGIDPQNIQRLYCTEIANDIMNNSYSGVIDGVEILVANHGILNIRKIETIENSR